MDELWTVVGKLLNGEHLEDKYQAHILTGDRKGQWEFMLMPPLTYIHASEAACTTASGRGVGDGKPMEQRAKSDAGIGFAESRRRKTGSQIVFPYRL